jgi:hypothetical protein
MFADFPVCFSPEDTYTFSVGYVLEGMPVKKLTLSADEDVIRDAKRLARRNKTSVSAMFSRFVRGMAKPKKARMEIPPPRAPGGSSRCPKARPRATS